MNSYIDSIKVTDKNGNKSILYPNTKKEAVYGLLEDLEKLSVPDITATMDVVMPNSYDGRLLVKEIGGVCEQESTTGKNLLDFDLFYNNTERNLDATINRSGDKLVIGTTAAYYSGIYCSHAKLGLSGIIVTVSFDVTISNGSYIYTGFGSVGNAFTMTPNVKRRITFTKDVSTGAFTIYSGEDVAKTITVENIQYELGEVATEYEPYTGGVPSPNPSYPQEIKKSVVSGIKTHGKNLVKLENLSTTQYGVSVTIDDGIVKINGTANNNGGYNLARVNFKKGRHYTNITTYRRSAKNDWLETIQPNTVFEVVDESQIFVPLLWFASGTTYNETIIPMICLPEYKDVVEPYVESVITLSEPIDLYGKGDVQDVITPKRIKRKFVEIVLDGSEEWLVYATSQSGKYRNSYNGLKDIIKKPEGIAYVANVLCSHYKATSSNSAGTYGANQGVSVETSTGNLYFYDETYNTSNPALWKAWLAENPVTVVFELAEETTEDLPLADQIALNSIASYDGITYLEFVSEIKPTFKGKYGTSEVGGYTLEGMLAGRNGELYGKRVEALEATVVNNI